MSSNRYWPDGSLMTDGDLGVWSDRSEGSLWKAEHLSTPVPGGSVSTVWLSCDHSYDDGPPLIFESMAFCDGPMDGECDRYSTREEAHAGHEAMVKRVESERKAWAELRTMPQVVRAAAVLGAAIRGHLDDFGIEYGIEGLAGDLLRMDGLTGDPVVSVS